MKSLASIIIITFFSSAVFAQAGVLDSTFEGDGKVITSIGSGDDKIFSVKVQSDNKIITAGYSFNGTDYDFALARYNVDGILDSSFGSNGIATVSVGLYDDFGTSSIIQDDGKIVVAGRSSNGVDNDFALVRFNVNGSLDSSFGTNGKLTTYFGSNNDGINSMALQMDGKIVAAGYTGLNLNYHFALARYNTNGSLDNSFGSTGKIVTALVSFEDFATSAIIQSDGKIVVVGLADSNGTGADCAVVRYNLDGTLDTNFGNDGKVVTDLGSEADLFTSVAIQSDGKIIASGRAYYPDYEFALVRYNLDGTLDNTFGTNGEVFNQIGGGDDQPHEIIIQPNSKIIVAGFTFNQDYDFALIRYDSTGAIDDNFGTGGILITPIGSGNDLLTSAVLQNDGKILAAGSSSNGSNDDFAVVRYLNDLTLGEINFFIQNPSPLIYPNPIQQTETLEYILTKNESLTIALYDVNGKLIRNFISNEQRSAGAHKETLNIGTLPSGNYFLAISNGSQKMTVKMVKQ